MSHHKYILWIYLLLFSQKLIMSIYQNDCIFGKAMIHNFQEFLDTWFKFLKRQNITEHIIKGLIRVKPMSTLCSVQFSSVAQPCPTLCNPMNRSPPGLLVHDPLPEFTQTRAHWISDAIQPSHPLVPPSSPAPNPSQHQSLFQWVNSSHEVAKVLEFQL